MICPSQPIIASCRRRDGATALEPAALGVYALALRARQVHLAFGPEHVAVQVGDPLPAAGGDVEIADRELDLRRDVGPVELREFIDDVGGRRVAQRLVQSDFLELVKQRI